MRVIFTILLSFFAAQTAFAQSSYWLPTVQKTPIETIYSFDTKLPDFMVPWVTKQTPIGGGKAVAKIIDGQPYTVIEQYFGWDSNGHGPKNGQIAVTSMKGGVAMSDWTGDPGLASETEVVAALDALVKPSNSSWRYADVLVLRQEGVPKPNLKLVEAVSEGDQIKARMRKIAESTTRGQYFPDEVEMPADMDSMRREMLAWGNLGRRDPTFREDNKFANDFNGDTVQTGPRTTEKLFKDNPQPPYFNDLVLDAKLNEACQFMAEYYAKTNGNESQPAGGPKHEAPGVTYKGADVSTLGARLKYFATDAQSSGEGLGGPGPADSFPEGWMRSETHYRPWFNIGQNTVSMGLGAAKTSKGWYFCKVGGLALPEGVSMPQVQPQAQVQPQLQPQPPLQQQPKSQPPVQPQTPAQPQMAADTYRPQPGYPVTIPSGQQMEVNKKYLSTDGKFYVVFQSDGNLVVARASDNGFYWGLNTLPGVAFTRAKQAIVQPDGRFMVSDGQGGDIWSVPPVGGTRASPPSYLSISDDGVLSLVTMDPFSTDLVTWSSVNFGSFPVQGGQVIPTDTRYYSPSRTFLMEFHGSDGNLVIARASDLGFVWGLNLLPGVDFQSATRLEMRPDGRLTALDQAGTTVWAVPEVNSVPNSTLQLSDTGALEVLHPDGAVAWSSATN